MPARSTRPGAQRAQQGDGARRGHGAQRRGAHLGRGVPARRTARGLLRAAREAGASTSRHPGWDAGGRWDLDDVLDHVDILLLIAGELRNLARSGDAQRAAGSLALAATVREAARDPMAVLVAGHRLAEATARARGLDPDRPAHLNRSVVVPA